MRSKLPAKHSVGINLGGIIGAQGATGSAGTFTIAGSGTGGLGVDTITLGGVEAQPYINFSLIKAHGGTIVQCRAEDSHQWEYYVIPENTKNFDRELGKIISMHLLKG